MDNQGSPEKDSDVSGYKVFGFLAGIPRDVFRRLRSAIAQSKMLTPRINQPFTGNPATDDIGISR
jgi:hypothetical protein